MRLDFIINYLEEISPKLFSFSNSYHGFQLGPIRNYEKKIIKKVLITLDPSLEAINYARLIGANLILAYNPLIRKGIDTINPGLRDKLLLLTQSRIMVYILNSWFDDDSLANKLGIEINDILYEREDGVEKPIGQICSFNRSLPNDLGKFKSLNNPANGFETSLKRNFGTDNVKIYGSNALQKNLQKIALIPGECFSEFFINNAYINGCNTIITGEIGHSELVLALEYNLSVICLSYEETINPILDKLSNLLAVEFPNITVEKFKEKYMISLKN